MKRKAVILLFLNDLFLFAGGELIFDEKDVELFADNILIVEGGKLQVRIISFFHLFTSILAIKRRMS